MARRLFNGNAFSENGWPYVDEAGCTWIVVPGTNPPVHLQIQTGPPVSILGAWAADWNAYIEPLRDADSACWTPGNSVATSNHPGGTAEDLDWESHKFQVRGTLNAAQMAVMAEMEDFYEGNVFWAGRWDNPVDEMHSQMGYDTYDQDNDRPFPKVFDFIARKIRADGFSTFRRGGTPSPVLSRTDRYALSIIDEGRKRNISRKGICIALTVPFVETGYKVYANSNVPESLSYPHDAVGSDHDSNGLFQQRMAWGPLTCTMDPACSAGLFYDGGAGGQRGLTDFPYDTDARTPGGWAQAVQVSAYPDRYDEHWQEANDLYDRLAGTPTPPGDDMAQVPQDQWDRVYRELTQRLPSRSPLRHLGEGVVDTMAGFILNTDGSVHVEIVKLLAGYGHPPTLALLREVAGADPKQYADRQDDAKIAQAILADVTAPVVTVTQNITAPHLEPGVVYMQAPTGRTSNPNGSTGQLLGQLFDALEAVKTAQVDLGPQGKASIDSLISVLQPATGVVK